MKRYGIRLVVLLMLAMLLMGCSNENNNELEATISHLEAEVDALKTQLDEIKNTEEMLKELQEENEKLNDQIETLSMELNHLIIDVEDGRDYEDLMVLTEEEKQAYDDFKKDYDTKYLIGLEPKSVMKLQLHAIMIEDYDTEYELYTKNEEYVLWSKEEHHEFPSDQRMSEFEKFKDVYNLKVHFGSSNVEDATITWKSKNGYVEEEHGAFMYGFTLVKDGDVWKVAFLAMQ